MKKATVSAAQTIAAYMTRLYENGMTTTSGGNLSLMDEDGSLWISPSGIDKAHLTPDDIMEVKKDGTIHGKHFPSTEYPFHLAVRRARPDLKAVLHAHPAALVALSLTCRTPLIDMYPGVAELCGNISIAKYAVPGSELLGSYVSAEFAKGYNAVLLENHGICLGAETMEQAYRMFEAIEYSARVQIAAATLGEQPRRLTESQYEIKKHSVLYKKSKNKPIACEGETEVRKNVIEMIKRCCKNKLFTASHGTFAARTSDGGFVISPNACDAMSLDESALVKILGDRYEGEAMPSPYAYQAQLIFNSHEDINSIAFASSPEIMGFAVTDAEFNSHLIPEGYICLRNVSRYKFGAIESCPEKIASEISMKAPIAIVENDCAIIAGTSPLNTYDRLEVMEFGALSLRHIAALGYPVVKISPEAIKEIEEAFNL